MSRYTAVDLLNKTLQYCARTTFRKVSGTIGNHVLYRLCPTYGSCQLSNEVLFDFGRISMGQSIYILINRTFRSMNVSSVDSSFQLYFGRIHEWRMESTAYLQRQSTLCTGSLHQFAGLVDTLDRTGDNDLSRTVIIGSNTNLTFRTYLCTDFFNFFVRQSNDGGHSGRLRFTSLLHSHCTSVNQLQAIFKAQCPGCHQCGKLTE